MSSEDFAWKSKINPHKKEMIKNIQDYSLVLDLGTGQGWYANILDNLGHKVIGVDIINRREHQFKFVKHSLEKGLCFQDNIFDAVLCFDLLEHVHKENLLLNEISRVLKNEGKLFVTVPHANDSKLSDKHLTYSHFKDQDHKRVYSPASLKNKVEDSGFSLKNFNLRGGGPYPYLVLNFIENEILNYSLKYFLKVLDKFGFINRGKCHGDIYAVFLKK